MTTRTQPRSRARWMAAASFAVVALAAAALFLVDQLQITSATSGGPEMALKVIDNNVECEGICQFELGSSFTLAVEIVSAPSSGYTLAQSFILFGDDLTYSPTADAADEIIWPDCEPAVALRVQRDNLLPPGQQDVDYAVNHGCLTGLITTPTSRFEGDFLHLSMTCSSVDTFSEVMLLPHDGEFPVTTIQTTSGSLFSFGTTPRVDTVPKLTNITIICGQPPTPTPGPTITPGGASPTPTATPTATPAATPDVVATPTAGAAVTATPTAELATATPRPRPCGDIDGNGLVNSQDALWVLWLTTGVINFVPFSDDLNGDGRTGPIDALLILQIEANLFICR